MADNFPIDIDFKKVNDWMYDRKKLSNDWAAKHKALGIKLADLFSKASVEDQDVKNMMKQNEDKANYLTLTKIIDKVLLTEEGKAKNMFGRYTSKNVNELVALKKLYEKDNLHIADLAKLMAHNAAFEIPAIKKNITAFENQIQELIQEEQSYKNAIASNERDFASYCEKLGIPGENIQKEVPALVKHLPGIFDKFVETIKDPLTKEILDYYYNFTRYINPKQKEETLKLKLLDHLFEKGDDLQDVYELAQQGKTVPEALRKENERKYSRYLTDKQGSKESGYFPQIVEISFGGNQSTKSTGGGGIDWGEFEVIGQSSNLETSAKQSAAELDFEIIDDKQKPAEEEVVNKDTILSNFDNRNQIIADLNELLFFVQQRQSESGGGAGNTILQAYEQGENQSIFEVSKDKQTKMVSHINALLDILLNFKARQYFILKEQPKASERIIANLNQFKTNANKARDNFGGLSKKNYDINKAIKENRDILNDLTKQTTEFKKAIEAEMKKLIKRDVFIIGDIHKILASK